MSKAFGIAFGVTLAIIGFLVWQGFVATKGNHLEPTGKIVTGECFQCLDCQVEYYDDTRCPPRVRAVKAKLIGIRLNNA